MSCFSLKLLTYSGFPLSTRVHNVTLTTHKTSYSDSPWYHYSAIGIFCFFPDLFPPNESMSIKSLLTPHPNSTSHAILLQSRNSQVMLSQKSLIFELSIYQQKVNKTTIHFLNKGSSFNAQWIEHLYHTQFHNLPLNSLSSFHPKK